MERDRRGYKAIYPSYSLILRIIAISAIILAIARPRSSSVYERVDTEGIDIILALDVSTSMLARDFTPDRINAAKDIAIQFIAERPTDRIGVVVFCRRELHPVSADHRQGDSHKSGQGDRMRPDR